MANIKNNLEKEVKWIKILYDEDKIELVQEVEMKETKQNPIFKNEEFEQREQSVKEKLIKTLENTNITTIEPVELDYEYLLGFYEGITRKTPLFDIPFNHLKGFYDAIQLVCKVHLKDKK